ncbi:MAG: 4-hydroxy-tetrahydrodipicolinate reductase [Eubacterium sp.]|nr:4-hydroxy-tetrahydrodipicolinate reductase [Eubacterium sp.]
MSIKVLINGAGGRMGRKLTSLIEADPDMEVCARVDAFGDESEGFIKDLEGFDGDADVAIDFSFHTSAPALMDYCVKRGLPCVVCTTGHTEEEKEAIMKASSAIPVFQSANMSVGIALLNRLVKQAALIFPDAEVEIIEAHHDQKADAPSGTALMLADTVKEVRPEAEYRFGRSGQCKRTPEEIGIHSLRMGNVTGEHEVIFATPNQTIRLKHEAHDRALFADGAIAAARFLIGKEPGYYNMEDLLG